MPPWVRLRRSRSISHAPNVSSLETSDTSMEMLDPLRPSFSASATKLSRTGAKPAVQEPVAQSASALPRGIRSNVGSAFKLSCSSPFFAREAEILQAKRKPKPPAGRYRLVEGDP